ncbi:hypothetical protein Pd630_LPD09087 (plasmid) [Rhodococcus opacus PD630]|nr:hypothetical protein Pd630_LPD09087 [Rhodococcus opacus PD630]
MGRSLAYPESMGKGPTSCPGNDRMMDAVASIGSTDQSVEPDPDGRR